MNPNLDPPPSLPLLPPSRAFHHLLSLIKTRGVVQGPVFETNEEEQIERETNHENNIEFAEERRPDVDVDIGSLIEEKVEAIAEEKDLKRMKDQMDHDWQTKKKSDGSFWSAASVFNKKLQQWRQKQKLKKMRNGGGSVRLPMEKSMGRRSCDIDPRLSVDDPRYSVDEPRASCDGYLIGRTTFPRMRAMVSLIEDAPVHRHKRFDTQIPVEDPMVMDSINGESLPGGSAQTRVYYSDSRRRKSLDRSSSARKTAATVVAEMGDMKSIFSAKVSPSIVDCRDSNSESLGISLRNNASMIQNGEHKGSSKKWRKWRKAWNILGFIHRSVSKDEDEDGDGYSGANGVERSYSYSECWSELRGGFNPKLARSNSCVSWRSWHDLDGLFGGGVEPNGRLKFDSTPMNQRFGSGQSRANNAHAIARRLY
ncbi:hypothetical protein V6N12_012471 [Hibiscus sabdariffa]|uniref:Uncharacterized protein n=1 Tax=Hibiscus sabdariffa TaxID=183260 RepID=A0ABR2AHP9_9ROSI